MTGEQDPIARVNERTLSRPGVDVTHRSRDPRQSHARDDSAVARQVAGRALVAKRRISDAAYQIAGAGSRADHTLW